jgi:3,5-epimerase/4-reductase
MSKKILIFGKGFIGERLNESLSCAITDKKIYRYADLQEEIDRHKPQIIINAIGATGKRNVDDCELDFDKTITANTFVPILFAEAAFRNNLKLVHLSSGCIYHYDYKNQKPISETLPPDFYDLYYSRSKIYAELVLNEMAKRRNILTLRVRIPLDNRPHPKNVLNKLIQYKTVIDIPNSVTYIPDFVEWFKKLIVKDARGLFNTVNKGGLRYPDLMKIYKKYVPDFEYTVLPMKKFNLKRTNLVLSTQK